MRVSVVDYLNARPLTWGLLREPPEGVSVARDTPSGCARKLASGEAELGLIPSIEAARIPGLRVVPGLGIAASSEVRSVLLVSRVSREKIRTVSLDPASRTSAALVRILLRRVYGLRPKYRETEDGRGEAKEESRSSPPVSHLPSSDDDAYLIIGDPALKTRLDGFVVLDLAAEWRAFSGHSFVFAVWAARPEADFARAEQIVRASRAAAVENFPRLVAEEAAESGLSEAVVEDYLRHCLHYELDSGDLEGLALFHRLAAEEGLLEAG